MGIDYPVEIKVTVDYLVEESEPRDDYYTFSYHISIYNKGNKEVRLLSRQWVITDGNGKKKEVTRKGVVGEQPYIKGGDIYKYTSTANFPTPVGSIYGKYIMQLETGELFDSPILPFRLVVPGVLH